MYFACSLHSLHPHHARVLGAQVRAACGMQSLYLVVLSAGPGNGSVTVAALSVTAAFYVVDLLPPC
jgi:hypothetical protein